jgi:hypothetical protein
VVSFRRRTGGWIVSFVVPVRQSEGDLHAAEFVAGDIRQEDAGMCAQQHGD